MKSLKISLIQSELFWENPTKNKELFTEKINSISEQVDVIVLPEMFTTGFTMNTEACGEVMSGETIEWMKHQAAKKNAAVTGSLIINCEGNYYNRLIWAQPDGKIFHYDKRHLFRMANEHNFYSSGKNRLVIEWRGWKIFPLICYDLRFPVWSRNRVLEVGEQIQYEYDCLINVANWPDVRKSAWCKLLEARAIENQSYVVGVNRVGTDENQKKYSGNSRAIDFLGNIINELQEYENAIQTVELSFTELSDYRAKFPAGMDADNFIINDIL